MGKYVSWVANGVLLVLCASLTADTANAIFSALLDPEPEQIASAPASGTALRRTWADREVILERNLFNSSILAPPPPPPVEEEELEATKLPLNLLGTVAAEDPSLARATVEDLEERKTLVLALNDSVKSATVTRIERRRVVLLENGKLRELALDDKTLPGARPKPRSRAGRSRANRNRAAAARNSSVSRNQSASASRVKRLSENSYEVPREAVEQAVRNPASLFSQAQIQPQYDGDEMVGMQINAIKPGSLFEEIGIQSGDIVTQLNGIQISSPEESARFLSEFTEANQFTVTIEGENGPRTLNYTMPEE